MDIKRNLCARLGIVLGLGWAMPASGALVLTGTYDPTGDANDVDASFTFASGTGGGSAANIIDLATFKSAVALAFANGTGGVMGADGPSDTLTSNTATSSTFGAGYSVSFVNSTGNLSIGAGDAGNQRIPTSGAVSSDTTTGGRYGKGSNPTSSLTPSR